MSLAAAATPSAGGSPLTVTVNTRSASSAPNTMTATRPATDRAPAYLAERGGHPDLIPMPERESGGRARGRADGRPRPRPGPGPRGGPVRSSWLEHQDARVVAMNPASASSAAAMTSGSLGSRPGRAPTSQRLLRPSECKTTAAPGGTGTRTGGWCAPGARRCPVPRACPSGCRRPGSTRRCCRGPRTGPAWSETCTMPIAPPRVRPIRRCARSSSTAGSGVGSSSTAVIAAVAAAAASGPWPSPSHRTPVTVPLGSPRSCRRTRSRR